MINTCSNRVIKYIMFGFNFIFVITGIIILSVGASVKAYFYPYETFLDDQYFSLPNMLIATGSLIFFISFLGCYGTMRENWIILMAFSVLLTIIFIFELSIGIAGYVLRDKTSHYIENTLSGNMANYKTQSTINSMWDVIQTEFQCCGVHDYNDWQHYFNDSLELPVSCCPQPHGIVGSFYCNSYTPGVTTTSTITPQPTPAITTTADVATTETSDPGISDTTIADTTTVDPVTSDVASDLTTLDSTTLNDATTESITTVSSVPNIGGNVNLASNSYPTSSSTPYRSGCLSLFGQFVKDHAVDIGAVGISLAVIQLGGIVLSFYMARQLKNGYYST